MRQFGRSQSSGSLKNFPFGSGSSLIRTPFPWASAITNGSAQVERPAGYPDDETRFHGPIPHLPWRSGPAQPVVCLCERPAPRQPPAVHCRPGFKWTDHLRRGDVCWRLAQIVAVGRLQILSNKYQVFAK